MAQSGPRGLVAGLLSERTLHALLALGAFLVLAAGTVISTLNPTGLSPVLRTLVVILTTALFYLAGLLVRCRLDVRLAGASLMAIGGAFAPMAVWAVSREMLGWSGEATWLIASLACLPLYLVVHLRLADRAAAWYAAVAGVSLLLSTLESLDAPVLWSFGHLVAVRGDPTRLAGTDGHSSLLWILNSLMVLAATYVWLACRAGERRSDLRRALTWAAHAVAVGPVYVALVGASMAGLTRSLGSTHGAVSLAAACGLWLGVLFYAQVAVMTGVGAFRIVTAWLVPSVLAASLVAASAPGVAYPLALAALALGFVCADRWRVATGRTRIVREAEAEPFLHVASVLLLVSVAWQGLSPREALVCGLAIAVALVLAAQIVPHRLPAWLAAPMLAVSWGRLLVLWPVSEDLVPAAWLLGGALLLTVAEVRAHRTGDDRLSIGRLLTGAGCRSRFAGPLYLAGAFLGLVGALGVGEAVRRAPVALGIPILSAESIATILGVAISCAILSVRRRLPWLLVVTAVLVVGATLSAIVSALPRLGRSAEATDLAIALTALGLGYLVVSRWLDGRDVRQSAPFFLGGYAMIAAAQPLAASDAVLRVQIGGLGLLALVATAVLIDRDAHETFAAICRALAAGSPPPEAARACFFALAAWLLPVWLLLLPELVGRAPSMSATGLAVAALALVWVAAGRWGPFRRRSYVSALYLGGCVMSAVGPWLAVGEYETRVTSLALAVLLYAGSAFVAREYRWVAPVTVLIPVLLWQAVEPWPGFVRLYGIALVVLGLVYLGVGVAFHHGSPRAIRRPVSGQTSPWARAWFAVAVMLVFGGLFRVAFESRALMTVGYALGCAYFVASGLVFRQPASGAIAVATAVVAYNSALTLTPLPPGWYGVGLIPGAAGALALAEVARRRLDRVPEPAEAQRGLDWLFGRWSLPLDAAALSGTMAAPLVSPSGMDAWSAAWWGGAAMLGAIAIVRRQPAWLYPAIGAALAGLVTTALAVEPDILPSDIATVLIGPVWILIGLSWAFDRRSSREETSTSPLADIALPTLGAPDQILAGLLTGLALSAGDRVGRWLLPVRAWGWAALLGSTVLGASDPLDGLITATAYGLLLAFVAQAYRAPVHAAGALILASASFAHWLRLAELSSSSQALAWTALALLTTLASIWLWRARAVLLDVWVPSLTLGSVVLAAVGVGLAVVLAPSGKSVLATQASAVTGLGICLFAHGCTRHARALLYTGILSVNAGYVLAMLAWDVTQLQIFAVPTGLALLTVAYLEWRRRQGMLLKHLVEDAGLALLLGASLIQGLGYAGDGLDRYTYDALLLVESSAIFGLGALLHWRRPFFAGAVVLVIDVGILLADPIRAMNTWYLVAAIGLVMIFGVILVEQRRKQIPLWLEGWRARLDLWD